MIRLKTLLTEQPGATIKAKPDTTSKQIVVTPFNGTIVAKKIYDSKNWYSDDEQLAIQVIEKNIKNAQQYQAVNSSLQLYTSGRGIGNYLRSFMSLNDRLDVVNHLMNVIPKNQWKNTIEKIVPWDDFKYASTGDNVYTRSGISGTMPTNAAQSNATTKLIAYYGHTKWADRGEFIKQDTLNTSHDILSNLSLLTAFLGPGGLLISAGLSLAAAGVSGLQGKGEQAGTEIIWASLPGVGGAVGNLIKRFGGAKIAVNLGKMLAKSKIPAANTLERAMFNEIGKLAKNGVLQQDIEKWIRYRAVNALRATNKKQLMTPAGRILNGIARRAVSWPTVAAKWVALGGAAQFAGSAAEKKWLEIYKQTGDKEWDAAELNRLKYVQNIPTQPSDATYVNNKFKTS